MTSKIAPHELDAFLEPGVAVFEIFDVAAHRFDTKDETRNSKLENRDS